MPMLPRSTYVMLWHQHSHNYLMTKQAHLTQHITQLQRWWLSPETYHQAPHESIHQAVQRKTSEVAAGEPDDRCIWQMVPSALASGQQQTSPLSFPLAVFIVLIALHFLSSFCHASTQKGGCSKVPVSPSRPFGLNTRFTGYVKSDLWDDTMKDNEIRLEEIYKRSHEIQKQDQTEKITGIKLKK